MTSSKKFVVLIKYGIYENTSTGIFDSQKEATDWAKDFIDKKIQPWVVIPINVLSYKGRAR